MTTVPARLALVIGTAGTLVLTGLSGLRARWDTRPPATAPGEVRRYFDVFDEANLPTWWASAVLLVGALSCAAVAALSERRGQRWRWTVLAALVLLLAIDEATVLHERLDRFVIPYLGTDGFPYLWVLPGAVLAAGVLGCVVWAAWTAPRSARRLLIAGFVLLLGSAVGGELVQGWLVTYDRAGWPFVLTYHLEEAGETMGAVALAAGALSMMSFRRSSAGVTVGLVHPVPTSVATGSGDADRRAEACPTGA